MRSKIILSSMIFICGLHCSIASQSMPPEVSVLDSLYVSALALRIDLLLSSGYKYFEINNNTERIIEQSVSPIFRFVTGEELLKLTKKKKAGIEVYRMSHKLISSDTIDINFSMITVTSKGPDLYYSLHCGGTDGYQPDIRFAFKKEIQDWELIKNIFISYE